MRSKKTSPKPYSPSTMVGVTPNSSEGNSPVKRGLVLGGDEAALAATGLHRDAERLNVAAGDVGAVDAGRLEDAERDGVDAHS